MHHDSYGHSEVKSHILGNMKIFMKFITEKLCCSIESTLGVGISAVSLTGEGRESSESSFTPLRVIHIPYHIFSMIDICDTTKLITLEERVLIYYKYDNNPVNCVKIFNSVYRTKPFGFRLVHIHNVLRWLLHHMTQIQPNFIC
jgi:hypothetical protein